MKSEEIALRAGRLDEPHITQAQREARDYVVSNGRLTGHEYGVALHNSAVIQRFTSNHQNGIAIPDFSGYPLNSVEVHHNHPVGDSFSASDIKLLLHRSDVGRIFVHGHNGFFAEAFTQAAPLTQDAARCWRTQFRQALCPMYRQMLVFGRWSWRQCLKVKGTLGTL